MKMRVTRHRGLALAAAFVSSGLALVGLASNSSGALVLNLNGTTFITDNGAGDSDPVIGRINNTSTIGGFGVAITIVSSNSPGDPNAGSLQVTSLDLINNNATSASLTIQTSDTNFSLPGGAGTPMRLDNSAGGTFTNSAIGNTLSYQSFADPLNGQPASAIASPVAAFTKSTAAFTEPFSGLTSTNWARAANPYSLSSLLSMSLSPGAQMNFSGTTAAVSVPEPGTVALVAVATTSLALRRRQRSR